MEYLKQYLGSIFCLLALNALASAKLVQFELNLTIGDVNPTGAGPRRAILSNNQFPGPPLYLDEGDDVEFLVRNGIRDDTAVHFHGIGQSGTPWSDGTPGVSQRQIRPGASYMYKWKADEKGVYFYHAHNRGQLMDGLYGAIVIAAPKDQDTPFGLISGDESDVAAMRAADANLQLLMISDWSQYTFREFYNVEERANIDFTCMDSIITNGVGAQYCLDRESLDAFTNPLVKEILKSTGEKGITDKGCVPPLQLFQGDFTLHLDEVPELAFRKCVGGSNSYANYTVQVDSSKGWAALTFLNPGGIYPIKVTIDNHQMYVYAVDGQYIEPQATDQLLVNNGNRISVFIKLDQEVAKYKIRLANDLLGQVLGGFAELSYDGFMNEPFVSRPLMDYAGHPLTDDLVRFTEASGRPYPARQPALRVDRTHKFLMKKLGKPYGAYEWTLSGVSGYNMSQEDISTPALFQQPNKLPDAPETDLIMKTKKDEWVDLILEVEGPFAQAHPMHKHGNKGYVLGAAVGPFPWADVEEAAKVLPADTFNFVNPPHVDSFNTVEGVRNNTWLALRYHVDTPGAWLFHCHIQTHLTGGMGMVIMDAVDEWPEVPEEYLEWNGFEKPLVS